MNIKLIKDGIMNYVRQISQKDRELRTYSLRGDFDFEAWVAIVEKSVEEHEPWRALNGYQAAEVMTGHIQSPEPAEDVHFSSWFDTMDAFPALTSLDEPPLEISSDYR